MAGKRVVGGNDELLNFKQTELQVSSRNLVESVEKAVRGGDRGLARTVRGWVSREPGLCSEGCRGPGRRHPSFLDMERKGTENIPGAGKHP